MSIGAFNSLDISVSALSAQRKRMDIVSSNLANANTTRTADGGPYQRQQVVFEAVLQAAKVDPPMGEGPNTPVGGVRVAEITKDARPPIMVHMPGHPDADANGNVLMPDVRPAEEMVDLMSASRSYEANATAFKLSKQMMMRALELGRA
jgi:flagellar basal-body rod protein FlgC